MFSGKKICMIYFKKILFENEDAFYEIAVINKELITKLHIILICMSSAFEINIQDSLISLETTKLYSGLFHLYYKPQSLQDIN